MRFFRAAFLLSAIINAGVLIGGLDAQPSLRGAVQLRAGDKLDGSIRFERDRLLLTESTGEERRIDASELKVAYLHLQGNDAKVSPGLKGVYYRQTGLAGPAVERVDETVDFNWGAMPPLPDFPADNFSVRWDGDIESTAAGNYSFHVLGGKGVRLWVNGRQLIDNWSNRTPREHSGSIELEGRQRYPLRLECLEESGESAIRLLWTSPGGTKLVIPAGQLSHFPVKQSMRNGLLGSYHRGSNFKGDPVERIDRVIDFSWSGKAPFPGFGINYFSVRWEGEIQAPASGPVAFHATTDDGVRLWVGGQLIIDEWRPRVATEISGELILQAGRRYPVRMDYYQATKDASASLSWSGPGLEKELVPVEMLFAKPPARPPREIAPGIVLKGGSFLAGKVIGMDQQDFRVSYLGEMPLKVRRQNIGALQFIPLTESGLAQVAGRRPGCVLRGGDYLVSELVSLGEGQIEVMSTVFGRRELKAEEVHFVKLGDFRMANANFEVRTRSGSLLRAEWLMLDDRRALVKDNSFCWINLDPGDVTAVYGIVGAEE
ncbi:MAG: PA14 domain-containing protein [Verrucomicrobiales bacterium]|nr:PA14 domain-containing protein [Verrucomicrobiales bacterium]